MYWIHIGLILMIIAFYLAMGGLLFQHLEGSNENEVHDAAAKFRTEFLANNTCVTGAEFAEMYTTVVNIYGAGVVSLGNSSTYTTNWNFQNSIFFSVSVITTIGYGRMAPSTSAGKGICILYAIIGIPIFFLFLAGIGDKIYQLNVFITSKVNFAPENPRIEKVFDVCFIVVLGVVFMVMIPAAIFSAVEEWDFSTSIYFTIVTLSTIGFGDYVAGEDMVNTTMRGWYRGCVAIWIFLGLAWWAGSLNIIQRTIIAHMEEVDVTKKSSNLKSIAKALEQSLYIIPPFPDIKARIAKGKRKISRALAPDTLRVSVTANDLLPPRGHKTYLTSAYDNAAFTPSVNEDVTYSHSTYL